MNKQYIDVAEVAKRLQTSAGQVLGLIHVGALHAINIALSSVKPRWRIAEMDFDAFVESRSSKTPCQDDAAEEQESRRRDRILLTNRLRAWTQ